MVTGPRCGFENCPSTVYHKEAGFYVCEEGHQRQGGPETGEDDDAFGKDGDTTRRARREREKVYQHLTGRKAFDLYLFSYQLILRKQIWYLINTKNLPAQYENIVKDLWQLRLENLTSRIDDEDATDTETQLQMFSSQSERETDTEGESIRLKGRRKDATPSLLEGLALCYLGMVLLRLPYTPGDVERWASLGELLYYRAIKEITPEMRGQLPGAYYRALDPQVLLKPGDIQHSVARLIVLYKRDHGMNLPRLNRPLLMFRYIKELTLPLDVYIAAARLAEMLGFTFGYPAGVLEKRLRIVDFPEAQLVAVVIISTKLLYPFDTVRRYAVTTSDATAMTMDWNAWAEAHKKDETRDQAGTPKLDFEKLMKVEERDVFSMSEQDIDSYLDFYEQTWLDGDIKAQGKDRDFQQALYKMFPTNGVQSQNTQSRSGKGKEKEVLSNEKLTKVMGAMKPRKVVSHEDAARMDRDIARPGSYYKRHRKVEDLQGHEKLFYEKAAGIAGLSLRTLVRAVFLTEKLVEGLEFE